MAKFMTVWETLKELVRKASKELVTTTTENAPETRLIDSTVICLEKFVFKVVMVALMAVALHPSVHIVLRFSALEAFINVAQFWVRRKYGWIYRNTGTGRGRRRRGLVIPTI
jgi:hypothetical protein